MCSIQGYRNRIILYSEAVFYKSVERMSLLWQPSCTIRSIFYKDERAVHTHRCFHFFLLWMLSVFLLQCTVSFLILAEEHSRSFSLFVTVTLLFSEATIRWKKPYFITVPFVRSVVGFVLIRNRCWFFLKAFSISIRHEHKISVF